MGRHIPLRIPTATGEPPREWILGAKRTTPSSRRLLLPDHRRAGVPWRTFGVGGESSGIRRGALSPADRYTFGDCPGYRAPPSRSSRGQPCAACLPPLARPP